MKPNPKYPIVIDHHFLIGPHVQEGDEVLFFEPKPKNLHRLEKANIWDLLTLTEIFSSKKDAQRNWQGIKELPQGYFEVGPIGKAKVMIYGLNAVEIQ